MKEKTYFIDGVEYTMEDIERFQKGRKTRQRAAILEQYEKMRAEEIAEARAYREENGIEHIQSLWIDDEGEEVRGTPEVQTLERIKEITVHDFVHLFYRKFWNYDNQGKNALDPNDQLQEVVSRIVLAAYNLNIRPDIEVKTTKLTGEVVKYHPHGDDSISESIKGVATAYKSQKATRLLEGQGNFGVVAGDSGAAGRYTFVSGTPLLSAIFKDMPYVKLIEDQDEGNDEPEFIPTPIPMGLINGVTAIGTGRSNYIAEREASEVIDWIDYIRNNDWRSTAKGPGSHPKPMSVTGSTAVEDPVSGYIVYGANVHYRVDRDDINKKGKYDVITELPPKMNADIVIANLKKLLPKRAADQVVNGTGKGRPTWIAVPTGYIEKDKSNWNKIGLQNARKEFVLMWDKDLVVEGIPGTMVKTTIEGLAKRWFNKRAEVIEERTICQISENQKQNHRINLIKEYADNGMTNWKAEEIVEYFVNFEKENKLFLTDKEKAMIKSGEMEKPTAEERGKKDADMVLGTVARAFLPANIAANEETRAKNDKTIRGLRKILKNIGDQVILEAREVIAAQEKFFEGKA